MLHNSEMKTIGEEVTLPNQKSNRLPDDSWSLIAEFAGLSAITKIPLICKDAKDAFQNNPAWKKHCLLHFPKADFSKIDEEKEMSWLKKSKVRWLKKFKELEDDYYPRNQRKRLFFRSVKEGDLSCIQELKPTLDELQNPEFRAVDKVLINPVTLANRLDHQDILSHFYHVARHLLAPSKSDEKGHDYISYLVMCDQADKLQKLSDVNDSLFLDRGFALFRLCIQYGSKNVFPVLTRYFPDLPHIADNDGIFPLHLASQSHYSMLVKQLLDYGVNVNQTQSSVTPLILAAQAGYHDIVALLLARHANVDHAMNEGHTALLVAAQNGHVKTVKLLLEKDADVNLTNSEGFSPLFVASQNGHYEIAELLLKKGAEVGHAVPNCGSFPLTKAAWENHLRVAELLLSYGADVNQQRKDGVTSLYIATQNGHRKMVELLVTNKADVNKLSFKNGSPIAVAGQRGNLEMIKFLEEHGGNIHQASADGFNAFVLASQQGHFDVVEYLFPKGFDVNHAVKNGATSLFAAAQNGHIKIVKFLLANGADPALCKHDGMSPVFIAKANRHEEIVSLLKEAMKKPELESKSSQEDGEKMHVLLSSHDNPSLQTKLAEFRDLYANVLFNERVIGFDAEGNEIASAFSDQAMHVLMMNFDYFELRALPINISLHCRTVKESELSKIKPLLTSAHYQLDLESVLKREAFQLKVVAQPLTKQGLSLTL